MTRGNQRDLARAKNLKKEAKSKSGNSKSGSELAKQGLSDAEKMRQKQAKGPKPYRAETWIPCYELLLLTESLHLSRQPMKRRLSWNQKQ
ncbi:hypothetical protein Trco_007392 [Trichoderma cornu-damae]|uniref:Small EDRK-rich factor-like N-terminal domain-containing protein n=1 Tax=Trichoderma cornu-damae TaxID=654480 RepID=A0A9P8QFU9_9HYPO|nr:hypothetical protein Trco_007392 [Trichoderma cornu-damae]